MEDDTSSTKDGTPVWSFNEVVRAILRCLGLEPLLFHKLNPSCPTPNKEDADGKLLINNNVQAAAPCKLESSEEAGSDPPSTSATDNSDPPSTSTSTALTDPPADPAPSTSTTGDDRGADLVVTLAAPTRPGTRSGRGGQIN